MQVRPTTASYAPTAIPRRPLPPSAPAPAAPKAAPSAPNWRDAVKGALSVAGSLLKALVRSPQTLFTPFETYSPARLAAPSPAGQLRVMSYNAMLGGRDYPGVLATIRRANPDVVGLQEISQENALRLAKDLGMHVAFFGRESSPFSCRAGKAILSKHPIAAAGHHMFDLGIRDHLDAIQRTAAARGQSFWQAFTGTELTERRGVLEATIRTGGKPITFLDTHLTLADPQLNARQLAELSTRAAALKAQGHEVVLMGDFNTNLALKQGGEGGPGFADATDTVSEYTQRYGKGAGNIADATNMAAADQLRNTLRSAWDAAGSRYAITEQDAQLTPEEARQQLASGTVRRGSDEWKRLTAAADGYTHLGANKRFDNLLVSDGLAVREAAIDMVSKASDHQGVIVDLGVTR